MMVENAWLGIARDKIGVYEISIYVDCACGSRILLEGFTGMSENITECDSCHRSYKLYYGVKMLINLDDTPTE